MAPMTNYFSNAILQGLAQNHYLALHSQDPTVTGNPATEYTGGGYARQPINYTPATNRTLANSNNIVFVNLNAGTVRFFAVWNQLTGGNCIYVIPIPGPSGVVIAASGSTLQVPVNDLSITLN